MFNLIIAPSVQLEVSWFEKYKVLGKLNYCFFYLSYDNNTLNNPKYDKLNDCVFKGKLRN